MTLGLVQCHVARSHPEANASFATSQLAEFALQGVDLVVFPEAFLTGYAAESREEALALGIPPDDPSIRSLRSRAAELDIGVVVGWIENDGGTLRNVVELSTPDGGRYRYAKTHLPELGADRYAEPGDALPVFDTPWGRIGILICFDLRAPEACRTLALQDADLVLLPTNWPEGAETSAELLARARAAENRVWLAACNRVGTEGGFRFIGRSQVVDPDGRRVAELGGDADRLIVEINLEQAREKRIRTIPDRYEWTVFDSRRPELYGPITEVRDLGRPRE